MFTVLIEIVMSVFIANFKVKEHRVLTALAQSVLVALSIFLIVCVSDMINSRETSWGLAFGISFLAGFFISFFLYLVEVFFEYIK